jgi:anti-sigma B factor antagonist
MPASRYPFQMVGGVPVVMAPAEIDMTTAGQLRAILFDWHSRGHATVIVDMTGTQFCDCAGLRELALAHQRAVRGGGGLRLVIPAGGVVLRVFTVTGLDRLIPRFTALEQALGQVPAAAGRTLCQGPHLGPAAATDGPPAQLREHGGLPIAAAVSGAALRLCRGVSTPGFAVLAAGSRGTASIWVILRSRRARWHGRLPR